MHPLRRIHGATLRPGLARCAGNGPAHRVGGLDCAGAGVMGHQEPSAEGCASGENSIADSGIADQYRRCALAPAQDVSLAAVP